MCMLSILARSPSNHEVPFTIILLWCTWTIVANRVMLIGIRTIRICEALASSQEFFCWVSCAGVLTVHLVLDDYTVSFTQQAEQAEVRKHITVNLTINHHCKRHGARCGQLDAWFEGEC